MLSAPVFDSWEGPNRQCAIGDAIFGKKFFAAYAHNPPLFRFGEGGPKTFFSETASTLRHAGQQCFWRRRNAESKPFRRVYGVSGGYHCARRARRDLSRIAHAHARNPDESRRRPSTPMACIWVNELKRFLSGDFWLHHSVMTYSFVTQPASSTSYADYTRRLTYRRSKVTVGRAAGLRSDFGTLPPSPGRHSPRREPAGRNLAGKASLKIRLPMPKLGWHVNITLNPSDDFLRRSLFSAMTAKATARLGRLPTQGDGEATARPNVMGLNVPTVEESGRCLWPTPLGTCCRSAHVVWEWSFLLGR